MMMMPTLAVATAHAFVLTVSHGLLFRQPPFTATALLPPILSEFTRFHRAAARRWKFSSPNVTSSINRTASANLFVARAKCVRAEPMKRHDLRTI
ncbi:MAG TPA: hypothetical protein VFN27_09885 [Xanthobacteraceae bacterium]|nr:hypothetical protein [Xanthobacteraceae bacterium]